MLDKNEPILVCFLVEIQNWFCTKLFVLGFWLRQSISYFVRGIVGDILASKHKNQNIYCFFTTLNGNKRKTFINLFCFKFHQRPNSTALTKNTYILTFSRLTCPEALSHGMLPNLCILLFWQFFVPYQFGCLLAILVMLWKEAIRKAMCLLEWVYLLIV
jgi:hypothetical protein